MKTVKAHISLGLLASVAVLAGCEGPVGPSPVDLVHSADATVVTIPTVLGVDWAPVFRIEPPLVDDIVAGPAPLEVTFGMCQSAGASETDTLTFTFDYETDGRVDFATFCRATHTYFAMPDGRSCTDATVCATSNETGTRRCRAYRSA